MIFKYSDDYCVQEQWIGERRSQKACAHSLHYYYCYCYCYSHNYYYYWTPYTEKLLRDKQIIKYSWALPFLGFTIYHCHLCDGLLLMWLSCSVRVMPLSVNLYCHFLPSTFILLWNWPGYSFSCSGCLIEEHHSVARWCVTWRMSGSCYEYLMSC